MSTLPCGAVETKSLVGGRLCLTLSEDAVSVGTDERRRVKETYANHDGPAGGAREGPPTATGRLRNQQYKIPAPGGSLGTDGSSCCDAEGG